MTRRAQVRMRRLWNRGRRLGYVYRKWHWNDEHTGPNLILVKVFMRMGTTQWGIRNNIRAQPFL